MKILFYRYVPNLTKVVKLKKNHMLHNVFEVTFDHIEELPLNVKETKQKIKRWLEDHYGICIYIFNGKKHKISNTKTMIHELEDLNGRVTVIGFNKLKEIN